MALNNVGLGMSFTAKDAASAAILGLGKNLGVLKGQAEDVNKAFETTTGRTRDLTTGRFAKAPTGMFDAANIAEAGAAFKAVGAAMAGVGLAGAGFLGLATHEAMKFGKSIAEVASITSRSAFPISEIERIGKEMASTYGGDLNQQVKALYQAASSGASNAAEATSLMHSANMLAVGGLSDSFKAIDALTNVLNAYGMKMTQANEVSDAMFVTAKIGKTTIDELASQIGRVAPTAAAMGVSMTDMMSAITAASTQLGNGSAAVDGLKEALANIKGPSHEATQEAARLGIKFDAAALSSMGFEKFLKQITSSAKFNEQSMGKLFGSMTAFNAMSALSANSGKAFADALDGMAHKEGAASAAFETMAQTGDFAGSVLKTNFQTALVNIGQVIAPLVGKILVFVNTIIKRFNTASPVVHKLATALVAMASGAAVVIGGIFTLGGALAGLLILGKGLLIGIAAVAGVFVLMGAALLPLIALAVGFYVAWTENVGGIADRVKEWAKTIQLAWTALTDFISEGETSGEVWAELGRTNAGLQDFIIKVATFVSRIKAFFSGFATGFQGGIDAAKPSIDALVAAIQKLFATFMGPGREGPEDAKASFMSFATTGAKIGGALSKVFEFFVDSLTRVVSMVQGAKEGFDKWSPSLDAVKGAFGSLWAAVQKLGAALTGSDSSALSSADTWKTVGEVIGSVIGFIATSITLVVNIIAGAISILTEVIGAVAPIFHGLWNVIKGVFNLIVGIFTGEWGQVWLGAKQIVAGILQAIIGLLVAFVGSALGIVDKIGAAFGNDLGLQKGLKDLGASASKGLDSGMGIGPAPSAAAAAPTPIAKKGDGIFGSEHAVAPTPSNSPGVAAAEGQADQTAAIAALAAKPAPPLEVTVKSTANLDGAQVWESMQKHQAASAGRAGNPVGTLGGE